MDLRRIRLIAWGSVALVAVGLAAGLFWSSGTPKTGSSTEAIGGLGGPFALVDQKGRPFTEASLVGKPTALFFGYTHCPDVCPTTLLEAETWMRELGADADKLRVVFVTVDPERDTPELLGSYLSSFDPRFVGLSGPRPEIDRAIKAWRVFARKVAGADGDYTMDHTAAVYLLDAQGRFVGIVNFQEQTDKAMVKLRRLIANSR